MVYFLAWVTKYKEMKFFFLKYKEIFLCFDFSSDFWKNKILSFLEMHILSVLVTLLSIGFL